VTFNGRNSGVLLCFLVLNAREQLKVSDHIVDTGRCQHRIEITAIGRSVMLGENDLDDPGFGYAFAGRW